MRLLIGTPCSSRMVSREYHESMIATVGAFQIAGIIAQRLLESDPLVHRARNFMASMTLVQSFDGILMIDADEGWNANDARDLVTSGLGVAGIAFPMKVYPDVDTRRVVMAYKPDSGPGAGQKIGARMFRRVESHGTGFLYIAREALESIVKAYPELRYDSSDDQIPPVSGWDFFRCDIDEAGRYLGEDYSFCRRWRRVGGEVWTMLGCTVRHVGPHVFTGRVEE